MISYILHNERRLKVSIYSEQIGVLMKDLSSAKYALHQSYVEFTRQPSSSNLEELNLDTNNVHEIHVELTQLRRKGGE